MASELATSQILKGMAAGIRNKPSSVKFHDSTNDRMMPKNILRMSSAHCEGVRTKTSIVVVFAAVTWKKL